MKTTSSVTFKNAEKTVTLKEVLKFLNKKINEDRSAKYNLSAELGTRYIRIVEEIDSYRSVYCFFDYDGNVLKAASWKTPAKGVRGTVFDVDYGWGTALGPYGAAYLTTRGKLAS
jgi:hypothetical protein